MKDGILERIEANQLLILSLLQASPVAIQGTLETFTEDLPDLTNDQPIPAPGESSDLTDGQKKYTLDSDGVPWDERIHSSNQKRQKGGEGSWMKRKNVDKDEPGKYARITAELREKYSTQSGAVKPHTTSGKPNTLPPPAAKGTPPPPPTGTTNVTKEEVPTRTEAINAINSLVKTHSVNYDAVTQYFIDNYNVSGFEEIPAIKHGGVTEDMENWAVHMVDIGLMVADIKQVYANDISVITPYLEQIWQSAHTDGVVCQQVTDIPFDQLEDVEVALTALHTQCCNA